MDGVINHMFLPIVCLFLVIWWSLTRVCHESGRAFCFHAPIGVVMPPQAPTAGSVSEYGLRALPVKGETRFNISVLYLLFTCAGIHKEE
jgi:hypothetical protein